MIPPFSAQGVLPTKISPLTDDHSPFPCTLVEIVQRYGFSEHRRELLRGFIRFRARFYELGFSIGEHIVGGSFVDDCERRYGRPPADIDVLTVLAPSQQFPREVKLELINSLDREGAKERYGVDARLAVPAFMRADRACRIVAIVTQLLTKDRNNRAKGALAVPFSPSLDQEAAALLESMSAAGQPAAAP